MEYKNTRMRLKMLITIYIRLEKRFIHMKRDLYRFAVGHMHTLKTD